MTSSYCEKFGLTAEKRQARLSLLGLGEGDLWLAKRLQRHVIRPHLDDIVAQFYRVLLQNAEFMTVMRAQTSSVEQLQKTQKQYLLTLGVDFNEQKYFEERLRVGLAHVRVKVSLPLYQCAFRILQQILIDYIPETSKKRDIYTAFILKITALDISLAIEAYHDTRVNDLQDSISELQSTAQSLQQQLEIDGLTHVLSRDSIIKVLRELKENTNLITNPACLVMVDLDHFKKINDSYGHLIGDHVLMDVAARMQSALRQSDYLGRFGGEEFILVLCDTSLEQGVEVAERIRQRIAEDAIHADNLSVNVTISQGIIGIQPDESLKEAVRRADEAMYNAKKAGRNRVVTG